MTKAPLAILAAGGTGGHMFPAQALAEALLEAGWRVKLTTDPRGARYVGGFPDAVQVKVLKSGTFARGGILSKALVPFQIAGGSLMALAQMIVDRPTVVIGFGGYPSIPALTAATILRIPRMVHEQNGVLGRVNQLFAPVVNAVACGTWPTEMSDKITGHHVGNPVRAAIAERAGAGYIHLGIIRCPSLFWGDHRGHVFCQMWCHPRLRACPWQCCPISACPIRPAQKTKNGSRPITQTKTSPRMYARFSMTFPRG